MKYRGTVIYFIVYLTRDIKLKNKKQKQKIQLYSFDRRPPAPLTIHLSAYIFYITLSICLFIVKYEQCEKTLVLSIRDAQYADAKV